MFHLDFYSIVYNNSYYNYKIILLHQLLGRFDLKIYILNISISMNEM